MIFAWIQVIFGMLFINSHEYEILYSSIVHENKIKKLVSVKTSI